MLGNSLDDAKLILWNTVLYKAFDCTYKEVKKK